MVPRTISGISLDAFANRPTPKEIACIVSDWASDQQAEFFSMLAEQMKTSCGWRVDLQLEAIAKNLARLEDELCDASGSDLLCKLASYLREDA